MVYFSLFFRSLGPAEFVLLAAAGAWVAVAVCGEAELRLGRTDPGEVILDEFVAMPFCYFGWGHMVHLLPFWAVCLVGLAAFRFFDIFKPLGINRLQKLPGGLGVVTDDLAAALATCVVVHFA
jgi:phosphatidylglycerophosphatase A